jgi:hypothetical protein
MIFMGIIFRIEKLIWIDSYFDRRNLTPEQSWKIARKLFVPNLKLFAAIFLRYLLPVILSVFIGIFFIFGPFWNYLATDGSDGHTVLALLGIVLISLLPIVYLYVVSIKLRFVPFLFLDTYGSGISWRIFFIQLQKLNSVATRESVTKTIVADFGSGTIRGLTSSLIVGAQNILSQHASPGGRVAGEVVGAYTDSVAGNMAELGRNAAVYLLYRYARNELYHKEQEVNEALYRLAAE